VSHWARSTKSQEAGGVGVQSANNVVFADWFREKVGGVTGRRNILEADDLALQKIPNKMKA
jgi:hypothetical protein